ncbi:YiiX/YebB-like N1pC/P60 family cysteine hydrolase [Marinobacter sp. ATCH36]|uniref:YiiX/YebB-like N1pC/P60 family cysteine hydrolase n=1 Tax=Marinobacter sp. ATCH36 TaxID=2945106 RepID=UPI002021D5EA|nr:YiiX/YebB-like N1pC/P60 family cysteine hydrolase [Marinobacter sp. ATCH36]MCL7942610.1 lipo-like protein [Marinobacter sp. ATCH36]
MFLNWLSRRLAAYLSKQVTRHSVRTSTWEALEKSLQPGDVLLVEGNTRISAAIKFLTQSTWSHAALYLGPEAGLGTNANGEPHVLVEADLEEGIRPLPLSFYRHAHSRVCRPVGLSEEDIHRLANYSTSRLGHQYDMKNVFDLARYLFPTPPIPTRYRHKLLAFGSGDPTRAICSTFIAEAFQQLRYPILPVVKTLPSDDPDCEDCVYERFRVRHHSLFTPRDFDASPYFRIIKPTLENHFDYRAIDWDDQ